MNEEEFKNKLKPIIRKVFNKINRDKYNKQDNNVDYGKFPLLIKFPKLKPILIDLLTNEYEIFIEDIYWVAPKPSTFKVLLRNNQYFYITHTEKSWIVKVEGKKYYLLNLSEEERAIESISRILSYGDNTEQIEKTSVKDTPEETEVEEETEETPTSEQPEDEE